MVGHEAEAARPSGRVVDPDQGVVTEDSGRRIAVGAPGVPGAAVVVGPGASCPMGRGSRMWLFGAARPPRPIRVRRPRAPSR
ncbi:hypothetical protein, partial [Streptomyces sp. IBSBF 3352]|uniref:hypothetical protein n=1 Tax=Streptomyces sp. IBSBF 3352 TaxID=2903523 RepID=UPI002FDBB06D